ncbi:DEAD/DEAH box helicase [Candidatus Bipolaricaulota bacterium]
MTDDVLSLFHPAVSRWFSETFAEPTPPQVLGWPNIAAGKSTLILAPTGSGKTLAAFLCAIDAAIRVEQSSDGQRSGVHTLYLSPLKALANDIERNLDQPLRGIRACASNLGTPLPEIQIGVRTGDTPTNERQKMIRRPPHLLITTPESLHLLLTSIKAREMLRSVRYVIVDEIHALCPNKRGTFLALLLERLEALVTQPPLRIGLSATQRPLSEIARFLGGQNADGSVRDVAIVDAGMRKSFDLSVQTPVADMKILPQPGGQAPSVWPAIYDRLIELVDEHESTLIFANSRRVVERIASEMNRQIGYERIQAHHGSISKERRHQIEQDLKDGKLPAVVATSSMELGIDVGFIDLVCQVEAPFSVASGLQRVGRAGHLVRATSKGRLIPKTRADLLMSAAISRSMLRGEISNVSIPRNPLDVLAQQIVSMVAVDEWDVDALYNRIRCAHPYRELPIESFNSVLELISGRFRSASVPVLRPRVSWDRATNRLYPLPGTRHLAILNGGVIPDTGQYPMVLEDRKTRLGELDEEFVFERRLGDTFVLGTGQWRILEITHDRVIVGSCDEAEAMLPFWKGEGLGHDWEFGARFGEFVRMCEQRLSDPAFAGWLRDECALDENGAANLITYLREQQEKGGALPTDRTVLVDVFRNEAGDERLALISPYGRSFHLAFLLLLQRALKERGIEPPEAVYSDTGLLLRLGAVTASIMMEVIHSLRSDAVEESITKELENSPYFALRFRRNAGRALLLPRARPGRRTPLWLQRLRSHDLLSFASQQPSFPIVLETYRELLEDVLPVAGLQQFLGSVEAGEARFVLRRDRLPSPFSNSMLLDFTAKYLYVDDRPVGTNRDAPELRNDLGTLMGKSVHADEVLDDDAVRTFEERLQGSASGHRARNGAELVELIRRIGDLTEAELALRCEPEALAALPDLLADGRIVPVRIDGSSLPDRLAVGEESETYDPRTDDADHVLVARFVAHHAISRREEVLDRYAIEEAALDRIRQTEGWVDVELANGETGWAHPQVLASIRRMTMSRRRQSVDPVSAEVYSRFLLTRQHVSAPLPAEELDDVVAKLSGCRIPVPVWRDALAVRIRGYHSDLLNELIRDGALTWIGSLSEGGQRLLAFTPAALDADSLNRLPKSELAADAQRIVEFLTESGASFLHQLATGLSASPSTVAPLLWDLIWAGWVTNDSLDPALGDKPQPERWQGRRRLPVWGKGRWSLLKENAEQSEESVRRALRALLMRYGVLTREILGRETTNIAWRQAYPLLTRMEWAGEVERALFVSGLSGPQFAFREAAELLAHNLQHESLVLLNVNDPANIFGDLFTILRPDGERYIIRHHPGNYLVLENGHPILAIENRGERLIPLDELSPSQRTESFRMLLRLVEGRDRPAAIRVMSWDGSPIVETAVESELVEVGFTREDSGMILYRSYA